jgi:hypothetical protein
MNRPRHELFLNNIMQSNTHYYYANCRFSLLSYLVLVNITVNFGFQKIWGIS